MKRTLLFCPALTLTIALATSACSSTGSDSDSGAGDPPAAGGKELHATVLDEKLAALDASLPATKVDVGNGITVPFDKGEKLKVAFSGYGKGFDYSVPEFAAAKDMAKELGIEVDEFDPSGDPQKQVGQLQDIMASGKYNAVVVYPLSPDLTCDLLTEQMPKRGILTAAIGNPACTDDATTGSAGMVTTIPDTGGTDYVFPSWAEEIAKREKGGTALVVTGLALDIGAKLSGDAVKDVFPKYDLKLAALMRTDFSQADALQKVQDGLQAHPDTTVIASSFPEGTQAALTAVKAAGLQDKVAVYDFGANELALDEIADGGVQGGSPFYPYTKVKAAFAALQLARHGVEVDRYYPYSGHAVESMRPAGAKTMFVTKDNVAEFSSDVAEY
ncbi:MAG: hypothetical protein JWR55_658 [Aeromicrobium sp.]|jgi:ribose transport system substrate-binding protein|nr:hypothetical protein [Aeromicrobium sp.]